MKKFLPPWLKYSHIERGSIGWRMGYGEDYMGRFNQWYDELTDLEKSEYRSLYPEPMEWRGYYNEDLQEYEETFHNDIQFWNPSGKAKYTVNSIIKKYNSKNRLKYIFFWGHQQKNDEITKAVFSQWYMVDFYYQGTKYNSMEQYMMAFKAKVFEDNKALEKIMNSKYPKEIKALGRTVKNFNEDIWNKYKYSIVLNGNYAKFSRNEQLREFLLNTNNRILVEASPYDSVWGIKMSADNSKIENPNMWNGENLLGFALMEVRDMLKKVYSNYE